VNRILTPHAQGLNLDDAIFFGGFNYVQAAQQAGLEIDPRFGFDGGFGPGVSEFQAPRQLRVGVKYIFSLAVGKARTASEATEDVASASETTEEQKGAPPAQDRRGPASLSAGGARQAVGNIDTARVE